MTSPYHRHSPRSSRLVATSSPKTGGHARAAGAQAIARFAGSKRLLALLQTLVLAPPVPNWESVDYNPLINRIENPENLVARESQKLSSKVNRLNPGIRANDDFGQKLRKRQKCRARLVKTRIPRGAKNEQKVGGIHRVQVRSQYFQAIGKSNSEHSDK